MLEIINNLSCFFEDCYRRISVREYSRIMGVSPPTASKLLAFYYHEGILKRTEDRNYLFFYANKESKLFVDLSRIYWKEKLNGIVLLARKELINPVIILFGSLSKGEAKGESDIDIAIISSKKNENIKNFGKKLKRNMQIFWFDSIKSIKNIDLANSILNGYILEGRIKL